MTNRSTRSLLAALLLIAALFVASNYAVESRPVWDWWLPLLLFIAGVYAALPPRAAAAAVGTDAGALGYTVREYTFGASRQPEVPTLGVGAPTGAGVMTAGAEEPGEVNVREPRDEAESQPAGVAAAFATSTPSVSAQLPPTEDEIAPIPVARPAVVPTVDEHGEPLVDEAIKAEMADSQRNADLERAGQFVPPTNLDAVVNPPTESDSAAGVLVAPGATDAEAVPSDVPGAQQRDAARPEMPLSPIDPAATTQPDVPAAERVAAGETLIQPAATKENEYQSGEHVAANQPPHSAPIPTQTTGEGFGAGVEPLPPEEKEVLDHSAAPTQPDDLAKADPTAPAVADAVMSGDRAAADAVAPREGIAPDESQDDLTFIEGIGPKMAAALRAAGLDSFAKLAASSDDQIRAAIEAGGMRLAPTLSTWREQAGFLARGDRAGFDALLASMRTGRRGGEGEA